MELIDVCSDRGKPVDMDSPDRPITEKRYDPVPQVTSQYNQPSPVLVNHTAHAKQPHTEGELYISFYLI